MTAPELPELPEADGYTGHGRRVFYGDAISAYGEACYRAAMEAAAVICDDMVLYTGYDCAAAIRAAICTPK
jgi:hypothetical protein